MRSRLLMTHPEGESTPYPNGRRETTLFGCRGEDHGDMERVRLKARLPGNKVYVSSEVAG